MADDGIKVVINPGAGAGGKRLAEPSPSFGSDRFTQRHTAAPAQPGTGARSEIAVEKQIVASQTALVAEIKQLRKILQTTAAGSAERTILKAQIDERLAQQKRNMAVAFDRGAVAKDRALATAAGTVLPSSSRVSASALLGAGAGIGRRAIAAAIAAGSGDPLGAASHALGMGTGAFAASRALAGAGEAAGAGAIAAEGAEAVGSGLLGSLGLPALLAGGAAAAIGLGIPSKVATFAAATRYGAQEEPRQGAAFRAAREFGETGASMIGATTGARWGDLGISPTDATSTIASMRETGGAKYVSNQQAYAGAKLGTYLGLTPEQTAQVGGAAGRLGVDPATAIRIIAQGVEQGNQQGRQFEVAQASLDYLKQIAGRAAVSGETGLTSISNLAAILAKSGIPGLQGAQGISAIAGIESAHASDDIFGVKSAGQGFVTLGETSILQQVNTDRRFASLKPRARLAVAEQIRQQGFSGPYAKIYGAAIHSEITAAESSMGTEYGLTAFEEANNFPVGGYRDPATGKWVSVNDSVTAMDRAFQTGDFLKASSIQSDLLAHGKGNISPMEKAKAGHLHGIALTGEAVAATYAAGERLETAGLSLLRRHVSDRSTASALDYLSTTLSPSKPPKAKTGVAYTPEPTLPPGGLPTPFATPGALPTPSAPSYAADAAGTPIAGAGLLEGAVLLVSGLLERIALAVEGGGGAPGAPNAAPHAVPTFPSRPDGKHFSPK